MAAEGPKILDGTQLRSIATNLPTITTTITGSDLLSLAESQASSSLFNLPLPQALKYQALNRLNIDPATFSSTQLQPEQALKKLRDYVSAIGDELEDDPIFVSVLDGKAIRILLEDEDDFAMLAENLFTDLDVEDKGKIKKNGIRKAIEYMGVEMGVPPFSEFPLLNDILKKHGAEGEEEFGQAQFAELLQPVLQDLADALTKKHIVITQNIKIVNGSKLRKVLADEKQLNNLIVKIFHEIDAAKSGKGYTEIIKGCLEKDGLIVGLPPSETSEALALLYDQVFAGVDSGNIAGKSGKDEFEILAKNILQKFAEVLEVNPIFYDVHI